MSTQKRIFSLFLSFLMIFSIITSAGITSFASDKPSFVIDISDAYVGEEVEIKVSATDISGLTAADLIFEYDQEYFEHISIEKSADALHDNGFGWYAETGILCYSFFYIDRATEDSSICVVRLKVLKEGATSISLKVDYWDGTEVPDDAEFEVTNQAKEGSLPYTYEIVDVEVTITDCDESFSGDIVIPETIEGYPVTSIGSAAFSDCTSLTSITIPDSVTRIRDSAFYNCESLTSITIPDSVTSIGDYAFGGCTSLTSITIPDSVTYIGAYAFYNCESLTSITIPDSVTSINPFAFYNCTSLTSITIPDSVTSIWDSAFSDCTSLTSITIPDSVTRIDPFAFYNCTSLTSITIPEGVTYIGFWAFYDCDMLESITILNSNCEIDDSQSTIYSGATIYGYSNSTAQEYAEKYDREFVSIGHEHSYTSKVTAPTCTAKGYTTYTCDCGDSYKSNYKNAKGHKYTNACDTSCNTCKATRKITHAYKDVITKATLTKSGKIVNKCSVCGNVSKTTTVYYPKTIKLSATSYTYDGKAKTPTVTVKDSAGKTLKSGTDYTVTYASGRKNVGQYKVTITMKGIYSGTKTLTFNILPGKTSKITATQTTTTLKATWNKVTGASGYKVELINSSGKVVKTVTTTKLTYTFSKLTAGTNYKVKVTAYKTIDKKAVYSAVSTTLATATKVATPTLKVTSKTKGTANLTWTNVAGENGYEVYYSTSKSSGFKSLASYKTNVAKGSKSKLTSKKNYYFKVRAYKTVNGKKVYGDWSKVVSVKIK